MTIKYSPDAVHSLIEKKEYLVIRFGSNKARQWVEKITNKIKYLELFPEMGSALSGLFDLPTDYRYLLVSQNYVFYRIAEDTIWIIDILDQRQDFMRRLFGIYENENDA